MRKRLDENETRKLLEHMSGTSRDVVEFLARTGCRISEALEVSVHDVDLSTNAVTIPTLKQKRATSREIKIGPEYAVKLKFLRPAGKLFPIARQNVWKAMKKAAVKAGVSIRRAHPHALRHGFAVRQILAGTPVPVVQDWLGHASLAVTQTYLRDINLMKWEPAGI